MSPERGKLEKLLFKGLHIVEESNVCVESDGELKADDDWHPTPIYSCYMSTSSHGSDDCSSDEYSSRRRSVEKKRRGKKKRVRTLVDSLSF